MNFLPAQLATAYFRLGLGNYSAAPFAFSTCPDLEGQALPTQSVTAMILGLTAAELTADFAGGKPIGMDVRVDRAGTQSLQ